MATRSPDQQLLRRTRLRLIAWSAGSTLVALLVLGTAIYAAVATSLADSSIAQLKARAASLGDAIAVKDQPFADTGAGLIVSDPGKQGIVLGGATSGTFGVVVKISGSDPGRGLAVPGPLVIGKESAGGGAGPSGNDGVSVPGPVDAAGFAAAQAGQTTIRELMLNDAPVRVLSEPGPTGANFVIQVAGDRTSEVQTLQVLLLVLLGGAGLVLLAALALGYVYAGRALVPIRESMRRQRDFAADASHELRTPLTIVRTSLEHLGRHPERSLGDELGTIRDAESEVVRLTGLVDDLLLLARTDSGGPDIERGHVDLAEAALDAVNGLAEVARTSEASITLDVEPVSIVGDPVRLRQLVRLLVDNALRHGPPGQLVTVRVLQEQRHAIVVVEDEGPGIRPADLPHIFERFYRAADAPPGGSGLGLAIAAWIAERHRGSIRVENLPESGARFTVTLPV